MEKRGTSIQDFQIICRLGEGSFGEVFKVKRIQDGQLYAMKKVKINAMSEQDRKNALNQIRILASEKSQHVIGYKEAFFDEISLTLNIIMQYAAGGDILKRIKQYQQQNKPYPEEQIWKALVHMTYGLKSLHDKSILHRDLKSANVFITDQGVYKLGDLNVSKVLKTQFTKTQIGTPYYTAPEIWKQRPYGLKCDMWSLGCVLYEMAASRPPFQALDLQGLYRNVVKGIFSRIPRAYSDELANFIASLLRTVPQLRPSTQQVLSLKFVHENYKQRIPTSAMIGQAIKKPLLNTLKLKHNNLRSLKNILPKANYEDAQSISEQPDVANLKKEELIEAPKFRVGKKSVKQILYGDRIALLEGAYHKPILNKIKSHKIIPKEQQDKDSLRVPQLNLYNKEKNYEISKDNQNRYGQMIKRRKNRVLSACGIRKLFEMDQPSSRRQKRQNSCESIENGIRQAVPRRASRPHILASINSNKNLPPRLIPISSKKLEQQVKIKQYVIRQAEGVQNLQQRPKSPKKVLKWFRDHNEEEKDVERDEFDLSPKLKIDRSNIIAKCGNMKEKIQPSFRMD